MPAQGLSLCELVRTSAMYSPARRASTLPHSTGPSPSGRSFGSDRRRRSSGSDPGPFALTPFLSTSPRSDSWHPPIRLLAPPDPTPGTASVGPSLALISAPTIGGFRPGFAFPVSRPFVCECRTIPAIPSRWTIPGLPGSLTLFPTVSPAHPLVRRGGTHVPSPP